MNRMLIISVIMLCLLSSCAIHNTFPFICFRKGCIKNQWHLREMKASLKLMKGNANKRKQIREAKNRKINHEDVDVAPGDYSFKEEEYKQKNDSVLTVNFKAGESAIDTIIIVNYNSQQQSILGKDSLFIKQYVEKHQAEMFEVIVVQEYIFPNSKEKNLKRKEKLVFYLEQLGIKKRIISSQRKNHLYDEESSEKIELRIRLKT